MVVDKRLDYGFIGYKVPSTPRATRSARRRRSFTKKIEDNQLSAFDLLATVAGKLLLENESSPTCSNTSTYKDQNSIVKNNVKKEWGDEVPLKVEPCDKGNNHDCSLQKFPHPQSDVYLGSASVRLSSERFDDEKLVIDKSKIVGLAGYREPFDCKLEDGIKTQITGGPLETAKIPIGTLSDMCSLVDPDVCDGKPVALVSSFSGAKVPPLSRDHIGHGSLPSSRGDVNLVNRDDDENSSGCTHPRTTTRPSRPPQRLGDRRIRRLLASKYWKVTPKYKDQRFCNTDGDMKPVYRNKNNCYKRQRSQRNYPFKKRKFFYQSLVSNSDGGISCVENSKSHEKGITFDASGSDLNKHKASGTSSSVACQHPSFQSSDSHVKLRIKSFRVPELFIEIPETATIGSLKRTVVEAVTAILGGGLHVGVLLQGKKLRDDNKTLLQTGISDDNQMDALGFTLEPSPSLTPPPPSLCPGDSPLLLPCDVPLPITRYPSSPTVINKGTTNSLPKPDAGSLNNFVTSDHDSAPSPTDMSIDTNTTDSKALVAVQAMSVEALAVVPMHHRFKREIAQRRIRRPFSVSEVEALVQAVEKLGTGRWRDVKLRAFDNAKHRTYVDLKDKWKTLVHTARISPQQRRGEPVPQELLDRVMAAHAYWSQQQAKQQLKQQTDAYFLL